MPILCLVLVMQEIASMAQNKGIFVFADIT